MASIFFRTAIIFATLSISMKLMGKRAIGELEVEELVTTLLISEICSIPIDDPNIPLLNALIPLLFIVSCEVIISFFKNKSEKLKRIIDGDAVFLIKNGILNQKELKNNRISIEEFFATLRQNGVGSISEINHCVLEANGKISVLKKDNALSSLLISDGEILNDALKEKGLDSNWIKKRLGSIPTENVFLMTYDDDGTVNIIIKEEKN